MLDVKKDGIEEDVTVDSVPRNEFTAEYLRSVNDGDFQLQLRSVPCPIEAGI